MLNLNSFTYPCPDLPDYKLALKRGVTDFVLLSILRELEDDNKSVFLSHAEFSTKLAYPVTASTKYDGEGVYLLWSEDTGPILISPYSGRTRVGLPVLQRLQAEIVPQWRLKGYTHILARCELYIPGKRGVHNVLKYSASSSKEDVAQLSLAVIRVNSVNRVKEVRDPLDVFPSILGLIPIQNIVFSEVDALSRFFSDQVEQKQEGIVIRDATNAYYKTKPKISVDAHVLGFVEGEWEGMQGIRSLLIGLIDSNTGYYQALTRVYSKMTDQTAQELLPVFSAIKINNPNLPTLTDTDGRVVQWVKPEVVIEVSCEEIIKPSADYPNYQPVISYTDEGMSYIGLAEAPKLLFPTFEHIRGDKTAGYLQQVTEQPLKLQQPLQPKIQVYRKVYTKELKGALLVKKILAYKLDANRCAAPVVVVTVDYSPRRAKPFDYKLVFGTEDRLQSILDACHADIKSGWVVSS